MYAGGPCKSHDRLRLTDFQTEHLVLGLYLLFICRSSQFYYNCYEITSHYLVYPQHFYSMLNVTSLFWMKNSSKVFPNWRSTHITYTKHQRSTTKRHLMLPLLLRSNRITPLCAKWFNWLQFKFRKPFLAEFILWKTTSNWLL